MTRLGFRDILVNVSGSMSPFGHICNGGVLVAFRAVLAGCGSMARGWVKALTEQAKFDHMSGAQVVAKALLAKNGIAQDQLNAHQFWLVVRFVQRGLLE